jgi:Predicted metal-dependent hydrolase with the TIM-barrel fold
MAADLIFEGGVIFGAPGAEALAIRCGRILAVGRASEILRLRGPDTKIFPLNGGFSRSTGSHRVDTCISSELVWIARFSWTYPRPKSLSEALELLRARAGS